MREGCTVPKMEVTDQKNLEMEIVMNEDGDFEGKCEMSRK